MFFINLIVSTWCDVSKANILKWKSFLKTFSFCFTVSVLIFLYLSLNDFRKKGYKLTNTKTEKVLTKLNEKNRPKIGGLKHILLWTMANVPMGEGQKMFIEKNCTFKNCFVTNNRSLLGDYTHFDVILFNVPTVIHLTRNLLPTRRSAHQKYVFGSMESSDYYPVCSKKFNNFFNWTWTYKLEPYSNWGYLSVRNSSNMIMGPKKGMHWMKLSEMEPVSDALKDKLRKKKKAAAWFVTNCKSRSRREKYVKKLQVELEKYHLGVDVYGGCGSLTCSRNSEDDCNKLVQRDYYFYLSFENSFAEDYVTEKLLRALKHDAVPIVYGGANYTMFMPDGIYLNARELGVKNLASKMYELITNPDQYAEYFRWKNHYSYHDKSESEDTDDYCGFCAMLNNDELVRTTSVYTDFQHWWDPPGRC